MAQAFSTQVSADIHELEELFQEGPFLLRVVLPLLPITTLPSLGLSAVLKKKKEKKPQNKIKK